jgi:hypothetical protein
MNIIDIKKDSLVHTTQSVLNNASDILYVSIDRQMKIFICGNELSFHLGEIEQIALSDLLEKDTTILQLPEFECGDTFYRRKTGWSWEKMGTVRQIARSKKYCKT